MATTALASENWVRVVTTTPPGQQRMDRSPTNSLFVGEIHGDGDDGGRRLPR
ncbi:hypothetical protein M6B38_299435 [Iris pallida]|uniref:Uncharacterized protein n=1 Tax=Iris pallida TaxID=29817 RepID=A0AAX6HQ69_IRIPA|nr:hypothetical protein M6B38_299435 [Iris pallida]